MTDARLLRHSNWDACLILLSLLHAVALLWVPSIALIAIGLWWNSNTISHWFLHLPFFGSRTMNRFYALYLSILVGVPQSLWRERHLAHHQISGRPARWTRAASEETMLIVALWGVMLVASPRFLLSVYAPGYGLGLLLCCLQGYFEHAGGTTSHYGAAYNIPFFNDGYHIEHHAHPSEHWSRLPALHARAGKTSRWPAVLRWAGWLNLESLERMVLRSPALQWFLLHTHERAVRRLLPHLPAVDRATIVGGGMFPRTALLLQRLLPGVPLHIVDMNREHLEAAGAFLDGSVEREHRRFEQNSRYDSGLLVIPLSFSGDREAVYRNPPAPAVLVHDWIWRRRGHSTVVSLLLLKRLNLIVR